MIKLRIKIKNDDKTFTKTEYLEDGFNVSKNDAKLIAIVEAACKDSHIEDIEDVKVTAYFEM